MEQKEKQTINSIVTAFIVKSRLPIIVILVALIIVAIVTSVFIAISNSNIATGLTALDAIEFKYESLDRTQDSFDDEQSSLIEQASILADDTTGVVRVRSLLFVANSYFEKENWSEALNYYVSAYEEDVESYTAPLALYNAAIASEELTDIDNAVMYVTMATAYDDFALLARSLFTLGRLEDTRGNYQEAQTSYQKLVDDFPSTSWANLARSRLITLRTEEKID